MGRSSRASRAPRRSAAILAASLWLAGAAACDRSQPRPPPAPAAQVGVASYYGREFSGRRTASGERHHPEAMTAASRSLPLGTTARVTNTETGRSVSVRVNDRGPYAKRRILDVSRKAARLLGMKHDGVAPVVVQPQPPPAELAER
jgi:rare lipoprotein A